MEYEEPKLGNSDKNNEELQDDEGTSSGIHFRRRKGMVLGLLKNVEPTDLRAAAEDIEIMRDCIATGCPMASLYVHKNTASDNSNSSETAFGFALTGRDGLPITKPELLPVRFHPAGIGCPINYLIAHGNEDTFHHLEVKPLVAFLKYLRPASAIPDNVFVIKLAACETGRGLATQVVEEARKSGLRLILLASPLFLYSLPVLDLTELATQKHDPDITLRKVNYQNTLTTRAQYEQCMCFGVITGYRELAKVILATLKDVPLSKDGEVRRMSLIEHIARLDGVRDPRDLKIPEPRSTDPGPLDAVNGACASFIAAIRADIVTYVNSGFALKSEFKKLVTPPSQFHLQRIVLGWFAEGQIFAKAPETTELRALEPTMNRIAALAQARQEEINEIRRVARETRGATKKTAAAQLPIPEEGVEFPLWNFYVKLMEAIEATASVAQSEFLRQLRAVLTTSVGKGKLAEQLATTLDPHRTDRHASVLLTEDITQGVHDVKGITKGGYLILSSFSDPLIDEVIRNLSTYRAQ
jgi:hypothetical protein